MSHDAVVIGAGPNGLVAANVLADAGWRVLVLEAGPKPGGAVISADWFGDGYVADVCSSFYPLAVASPAIASLRLEAHGLTWARAPLALANPLSGTAAAAVYPDAEETAATLEEQCPGDGDVWRRWCSQFDELAGDLLSALCTPFPPVRAVVRLVARLGAAGALRFARTALLPVRRLGEEELGGLGARLLLAGCTAHTDLAPESSGGAFFGWLLAMLAQRVGFPVAVGGASELTGALVRRLERRGGEVRCGVAVTSIVVRGGKAVGVEASDGSAYGARRAVLADVGARALYEDLLDRRWQPARLRDDVRRFQLDPATIKVDWATSGPIPWRSDVVRRAGTVHVAGSVDELTRYAAELAMGEVPSRPFVLVGQDSVADASRAPSGAQVVWAYSRVPATVRGDPFGVIRGTWDEADLAAFADRLEARMEVHAPGWRSLVTARHIMGPAELAAHDANLIGGAINGGTAALHQQLVMRPTPGLGRPETAVEGLYLASASAHPGGGVHGACGANAARAALRARGIGAPAARLLVAAQRRLGS